MVPTNNTTLSEELFVSQLQIEDIKESQVYIKKYLIPTLDKNYQLVKKYLKGSSRKLVYSIRRSLIDLLDENEEIRLTRHSHKNIQINDTLYETSFIMLEYLNLLFFFSAVLKKKTLSSGDTKNENTLRKILSEVKLLQSDIQTQVEFFTIV
jgi:hypothetical protein